MARAAACAALSLVMFAATTFRMPQASAGWGGEAKWTVVPDGPPTAPVGRPNVHILALTSVAVNSVTDAWAFGLSVNESTGVNFPAAEHWNGQYWSYVSTPVAWSFHSMFYDGATFSPSDVWAVGDYLPDGSSPGRTLAEHYDGHAWSQVPTVNPERDAYFYGVGGAKSRDLWAVGAHSVGRFTRHTLVEHWDGSAWSIVPSPNLLGSPATNELHGVAALSSSDAWAVGRAYYDYSDRRAFIEHWNGHAWKVIPAPRPGDTSELSAVAAISPTDVWATGDYTEGDREFALVEHWNGTRWRTVPAANPGHWNGLGSLAVVSPRQVWAVGGYFPTKGSHSVTLTERWNGKRWSVVPSPNLPTTSGGGNGLFSVAVIPTGGGLWAVGSFFNENAPSEALIERYGIPFCSDGVDNDHDGLADYPDDPGCTSRDDGSEIGTHKCDDGLDNDGDGRIDYRVDGSGDSDCLSPSGDTELVPGPVLPTSGEHSSALSRREGARSGESVSRTIPGRP